MKVQTTMEISTQTCLNEIVEPSAQLNDDRKKYSEHFLRGFREHLDMPGWDVTVRLQDLVDDPVDSAPVVFYGLGRHAATMVKNYGASSPDTIVMKRIVR